MWYHLNRFTQKITSSLFIYDAFINAASSNVVRLCCLNAQKTFVVSQVEVGLVTIYRNIAFSVLVRVQCSRINIDIRVKLLNGYFITSCLKQFTDGR